MELGLSPSSFNLILLSASGTSHPHLFLLCLQAELQQWKNKVDREAVSKAAIAVRITGAFLRILCHERSSRLSLGERTDVLGIQISTSMSRAEHGSGVVAVLPPPQTLSFVFY